MEGKQQELNDCIQKMQSLTENYTTFIQDSISKLFESVQSVSNSIIETEGMKNKNLNEKVESLVNEITLLENKKSKIEKLLKNITVEINKYIECDE